ncbi:uncharacterized protein LOC106060174 isoform X2 [Biomphalaria glabrata]|uniref:Uncharacterized protein LOC106060174 isoform X2 n=1 Tax=Biomphalaria glabrata TaxID=6526 RepID=A0A9W3BGA3_BIOGL|nr:uncharacterized protein LOC106060174 isoform X2 [Biomphalaria glabrata]
MSRLSLMLLKMSQSDTKKERKKKKGKDKKDSDENVGDEGSPPLEVSSSKKLSLEADAMNTAHKASTSSVNDQLEEGKVKSITELLEKKTATRVSSQNQLANKSEEARKTMIKSRLQAGQARQRARDASAAKDVNSEPNGEEPMKNREAIEEARRARKKAILESRKISAKNREAATDEAQLANNDVVKTRRKASLGRGRDSIGNTDALKYNIEVTKATDEVPTVTDELPSSNDEFPTIDEALTVNDEDLTSKDDEPVTKGEISSIKSEISSQTSPHFDSQKVKTKNSDVKTSTKESQNMLNVIKEEPNTERIVSAKGSRSNTLTDDKVMDLARELVSNTAESIRTLIQDERQRSSEVQRIDSQAENVSNTAGRVEERDQAGETQNSETLADFVSRSVHSLVRLRKEQSAIETLETIKTILESSTSLAQTKKVSSNSVEVQTQREPASMLHTQEATKLPSGADVLTAFVSNEDVNNQRKLNLNNAMYFDDCLNVDSEKNNDKMRFKESCKLNCSLCSTNKSLSKARCVPCLSTCRNCFRPVKAKKHLAQANEGQCSTTFRDSFDLQEARQGFQEQSLMKSRYVTVQGSGPPNFTQVSGPPNFTQVSGQPNYVRGNGQSNCIESNGQSNCIRGNVQSKCTKGCGSTNCSQASGPHNFTQVSSPSIYAQSSIPHNLTQGTCPTNCGQCRNPLFCSLKNQSNQRSQSRDGRTSSMDQRNIVSNTNGINTSKIDVNNMSQDQDNAMHCYNQCHNYEATQLNQARNHELNSVKQGLNYEMNQSLPDQCVRQELNYATNQSLGVDENTRMDDVQQGQSNNVLVNHLNHFDGPNNDNVLYPCGRPHDCPSPNLNNTPCGCRPNTEKKRVTFIHKDISRCVAKDEFNYVSTDKIQFASHMSSQDISYKSNNVIKSAHLFSNLFGNGHNMGFDPIRKDSPNTMNPLSPIVPAVCVSSGSHVMYVSENASETLKPKGQRADGCFRPQTRSSILNRAQSGQQAGGQFPCNYELPNGHLYDRADECELENIFLHAKGCMNNVQIFAEGEVHNIKVFAEGQLSDLKMYSNGDLENVETCTQGELESLLTYDDGQERLELQLREETKDAPLPMPFDRPESSQTKQNVPVCCVAKHKEDWPQKCPKTFGNFNISSNKGGPGHVLHWSSSIGQEDSSEDRFVSIIGESVNRTSDQGLRKVRHFHHTKGRSQVIGKKDADLVENVNAIGRDCSLIQKSIRNHSPSSSPRFSSKRRATDRDIECSNAERLRMRPPATNVDTWKPDSSPQHYSTSSKFPSSKQLTHRNVDKKCDSNTCTHVGGEIVCTDPGGKEEHRSKNFYLHKEHTLWASTSKVEGQDDKSRKPICVSEGQSNREWTLDSVSLTHERCKKSQCLDTVNAKFPKVNTTQQTDTDSELVELANLTQWVHANNEGLFNEAEREALLWHPKSDIHYKQDFIVGHADILAHSAPADRCHLLGSTQVQPEDVTVGDQTHESLTEIREGDFDTNLKTLLDNVICHFDENVTSLLDTKVKGFHQKVESLLEMEMDRIDNNVKSIVDNGIGNIHANLKAALLQENTKANAEKKLLNSFHIAAKDHHASTAMATNDYKTCQNTEIKQDKGQMEALNKGQVESLSRGHLGTLKQESTLLTSKEKPVAVNQGQGALRLGQNVNKGQGLTGAINKGYCSKNPSSIIQKGANTIQSNTPEYQYPYGSVQLCNVEARSDRTWLDQHSSLCHTPSGAHQAQLDVDPFLCVHLPARHNEEKQQGQLLQTKPFSERTSNQINKYGLNTKLNTNEKPNLLYCRNNNPDGTDSKRNQTIYNVAPTSAVIGRRQDWSSDLPEKTNFLPKKEPNAICDRKSSQVYCHNLNDRSRTLEHRVQHGRDPLKQDSCLRNDPQQNMASLQQEHNSKLDKKKHFLNTLNSIDESNASTSRELILEDLDILPDDLIMAQSDSRSLLNQDMETSEDVSNPSNHIKGNESYALGSKGLESKHTGYLNQIMNQTHTITGHLHNQSYLQETEDCVGYKPQVSNKKFLRRNRNKRLKVKSPKSSNDCVENSYSDYTEETSNNSGVNGDGHEERKNDLLREHDKANNLTPADEQILQEASHNPRSLKKERCSPGKTEMPSKEVFQGYCSCLQNIEADEQCCCAMRQCASIHPNQNDAVKESNKPQEENKQLAQEVKPVCQFTFIPYESEPSRDSLLSGSTNFIDGRLYIDVCNTYPLISSSSHQFENEYKQEPVTDKLVCDMGTPQALSCDYELLSPDTCEKPCYKSDEISERCECHSQNSKQKTKTDIRSSSKLDKNVLGKICQINKLCNYKLSNECKNPESTCVDKQNQHVQNVGSVKPSDGCKRQTRDAECIYPDIAENLQCESEDANSERKLLNDVVSNDSSDCPTVPTSKVDACTDVKDLPSMEVSSCHVSCNVCEDFKELLQESSSNEETESCTVSSVGTVHRSTEPAQRSKHFKTFSRPTWKKHVQLSDGDDDGSLSPNRYCKHQKDDKKRTTDRGFRIEDDMLVYGSRTAKVRMAGNETDYERYRKHLHGSLTHLDNTRGDSPCNDERTTASDFSGEEDNQEPVGRCMRCKRALNLEASDDTDDYMPKRSRSLDFERYQNCRAKQNTCSERDNYCYEVDSEFNVPSLTECCMKHSRYKKYSKTNQRRSHGQSVTKYQRDRREDSYENEYGADPTEVMYVRCESPKPSHYVDEIGFVKEKRGHSRSPARQHREYVEPEKVCRSQRTCDCNEDHEESFANDHYKGYPVSHRSMYAGKAESRDPTYHRMEENEENCATKMQSQSPYQSDFSTERSDRFYYNDKSASASKARSHPMAGFKAQAEVPKQNSLLPEDTSKVVYAPISPRGQAKLCLSQTPQWSPNDTKRSSNCCQGLFRNQSGYQMLGVYKEVDERSNSSKVPQQYQHYPDSSQRIPRGCFMNREEERET